MELCPGCPCQWRKGMVMQNLPVPDELATIREQIKALERREAELRAAILTEPEARAGKDWMATVTEQKSQRVNLDRLRALYPDIAEDVTEERTTVFVRLRANP